MKVKLICAGALLVSTKGGSFLHSNAFQISVRKPPTNGALKSVTDTICTERLDPNAAGKFKILTCSSSACAAKRNALHLDEFATFRALYCRMQDRSFGCVPMEECPCLGACENAPAVAVEHDDYEGRVSLQGMTESEFSERVFHRVIDEDDVERVWSAVENAIYIMSREENTEYTTYIHQYS
jgi:hypothetical protein